MKLRTPLSEIMTTSVIVAHVNNSLSQVMQFFRLYKVQHLPITEGSVLMGILSINDVMDFLSDEMLKNGNCNFDQLNEKFKITNVMTTLPNTLSEKDTVSDAVHLFNEKKYQSVPIVDGDGGRLIGIVTTNDIIKYLD